MAISSRGLYRSGQPQSTDDWPGSFFTMQGTGPPPPGLQIGKVAACTEDDFGGAAFGDTVGAVTGGIVGDAACCEGIGGGEAEGHGCTLIPELAPPGCRSDTSFSGTAVAAFGRVRSSQ